jgi:hypothetical protein
VYSATKFMLGCSPNKAFQVEVVDKLIAELWKMEERSRALRDLARGSVT